MEPFPHFHFFTVTKFNTPLLPLPSLHSLPFPLFFLHISFSHYLLGCVRWHGFCIRFVEKFSFEFIVVLLCLPQKIFLSVLEKCRTAAQEARHPT